MYVEPTTAAEVWARARLIKGRPASPVFMIPRKLIQRDWIRVATPGFDEKCEMFTSTRLALRSEVLKVTGVSMQDFISHKRTKHFTQARFSYYWLCAQYTGSSYPAIGKMVGNRDHTTVMAAFHSQTMKRFQVVETIQTVIKNLGLPPMTKSNNEHTNHVSDMTVTEHAGGVEVMTDPKPNITSPANLIPELPPNVSSPVDTAATTAGDSLTDQPSKVVGEGGPSLAVSDDQMAVGHVGFLGKLTLATVAFPEVPDCLKRDTPKPKYEAWELLGAG